VERVWIWELTWTREFFEWEQWQMLGGGYFTVKIMYSSFFNFIPRPSLEGKIDGKVLAHLCESFVPSKIVIFSWKLLLGRLPTRGNLDRRGVIGGEGSSCVRCQGKSEDESYILLSYYLCPIVEKGFLSGLVWSLCFPEIFLFL